MTVVEERLAARSGDANAWTAAAEKIPLTARTVLFCGQAHRAIPTWRRRAPDGVELQVESGDPDDWGTKAVGSPPIDAIVIDGAALTGQHFARIRSVLSPGAVVICVAPNQGHWMRIKALFSGSAASSNSDFSEPELVATLQGADWSMLELSGVVEDDASSVLARSALAAAAPALGAVSADVLNIVSTSHWIAKAEPAATRDRLTIAAYGMKKTAGVTEARVDYPMAALASLPQIRAAWGAGTVSLPRAWPAGVFILHRQFLNGGGLAASIDNMIDKGWSIVSDIDDDPHHWAGFVDSDFRAYRAVHAVTVSTEPLAAMIRQWNPNVTIFGNAIATLPDVSPTTPKRDKIRIFFGALNRERDWGAIAGGVFKAVAELGGEVTFVVVHDRDFFDRLPTTTKEFHPTLAHHDYMAVLSSCDIALLPLADTAFNRLKSDLKFIECCAAGVVPICSPVVYADEARHLEIGSFATSADDWHLRIVDLARDRDQITARRRAGVDYVSSSRMHRHQVVARLAFYQGVVEDRADLERQRLDRIRVHASLGDRKA